MTNADAVTMWLKYLAAKTAVRIIPTPANFEVDQPFVVVVQDNPKFVMGDFGSVEAAQRFCKQNNLPVTADVDQGLSVALVSTANGFSDYDVQDHPILRRATVPDGIRKGQTFNVYFGESSKGGAKWLGCVKKSLAAWLVANPSLTV